MLSGRFRARLNAFDVLLSMNERYAVCDVSRQLCESRRKMRKWLKTHQQEVIPLSMCIICMPAASNWLTTSLSHVEWHFDEVLSVSIICRMVVCQRALTVLAIFVNAR
jgi:hypothetical protein